jgi:hypothetical protein
MIQLHSCLSEELGGEAHIFGSVHAPEPQFLFMALEEVQRLLELLHGTVKRRSEEEDPQIPSVTRVENLDSNTILTSLISFHAATVVVADDGCAGRRLLRIHKVLRSWRWGAMADSVPVSVGFQREVRTTVVHWNSGSPKLKSAIWETPIGYRDEARKTSTLQMLCKYLVIKCLG